MNNFRARTTNGTVIVLGFSNLSGIPVALCYEEGKSSDIILTRYTHELEFIEFVEISRPLPSRDDPTIFPHKELKSVLDCIASTLKKDAPGSVQLMSTSYERLAAIIMGDLENAGFRIVTRIGR